MMDVSVVIVVVVVNILSSTIVIPNFWFSKIGLKFRSELQGTSGTLDFIMEAYQYQPVSTTYFFTNIDVLIGGH